MKKNLLLIIAVFVCAFSYGQGEMDAYRYSNKDLSGTARGQAMGGAFGALGGDVTGVAINPAGIGVYRSSEVLVNFSLTSPSSKFLNTNTQFGIDNLSYVGCFPLTTENLLSLNFGFNYNRIKNFEQRYSASRPKMGFSLTDYMEVLTNGVNHGLWDTDNLYSNGNVPWLSILAWDGYLIDPVSGTDDMYATILEQGELVRPSLNVSERGKIEVYDFTIGANHANTFFWGITLALTDLSYLMRSSYDENFLGDLGGGFRLDNYLETKGSGIQMKLGAIYKPTDALRLGITYHSPTWYSMTDSYQGTLTPRGIFDDDGNLAGRTSTPKDVYTNYYLRSPGSWTFSLAGVLGTQAILSLDYEVRDYSAMNLRDADGFDSQYENRLISKHYKNTSTVRAGFEFKFTPQFSGRLGYAWAQNPFQSGLRDTGEKVETVGTIPHYSLSNCATYLTTGIGFRFTPQFYGDFALVMRTQKDDLYYFPSKLGDDVLADSFEDSFTNKTIKALVTLGYRF